jgi:hypothetical protein
MIHIALKASKFLNDKLSTDFKYPGLKIGRNFVSDDSLLRENLLKYKKLNF